MSAEAFLPCGGCGSCERCEALRWACRLSSDAERRTAREWCRWRPDGCKLQAWALDALHNAARAAELLRVLLEARGTDVALFGTNGERCGTGRDVKIYTYSDGVAWWCTGDKRPAFPPMGAVAAIILALLGIKPGEQREAAMRAVEAAR